MAPTWGRKSAALTERSLSSLAMLHLPQGLKSPPRPCTPLFIIMHVPPRRRPLLSSIAPETTALVFDVFNLTAHYLCGHSWRKKPRTDRRVLVCVSRKLCVCSTSAELRDWAIMVVKPELFVGPFPSFHSSGAISL